jgi:hypothetical protein
MLSDAWCRQVSAVDVFSFFLGKLDDGYGTWD